MSAQLTKGERTVLRKLVSLGEQISVAELSEKLKEREERVLSILNSLNQRGFVILHAIESTSVQVTAEGESYLDGRFPEEALADAIAKLGYRVELDKAISKAGIEGKAKGIAVKWAKQFDMVITSKEGNVTIVEVKKEPIDSKHRELLENAAKEIDADLVIIEMDEYRPLIERKLLIPITRNRYEVEINPIRLRDITELLETSTDGIENLTSELLLSESWKNKKFRPYNVESKPPFVNYGKKHPYAEFNDWLREILVGMGFIEWFGPYVETEFWNNDTLFVPQDHVAREVQDQYRVVTPYDHGTIPDEKYYRAIKEVHENGGDTGSKGWESPYSREVATRLCLRAHTTPVSMRYLWEHKESPQKMFIIDRNFRSETLSARHAQEFNQCEGIIMDVGLNLRDLLGYLTEICRRVGIKKMKWKPGQFPFTEPSIEVFAKHDVLGWIEVAPGGIFRPEVTQPLGIKDPVLAWGIGSGRLFMASMGINDIRELYSRDLNWLRRSYFVR